MVEPIPVEPEPIITGIKHYKNISECPIKMVTVYRDNRAEITRHLTFVPDTIGIQDVVLDGLFPSEKKSDNKTIEESFRITGGIGDATVLEISHEQVEIEEKDHTLHQLKTKKLKSQIDEIKYKLQQTNIQLEVLQAEETWINEYSNSLINNQKGVINPVTPDQFSQVLEWVSSNLYRIDHEKFSLEYSLKEHNIQLEKLEKQHETEASPEYKIKNLTTVTLHIKNIKEVSLNISYVIPGAKWVSRYDNRVFSAKKSCNLSYLGVITNSTGEDWNNVNLHLSTASPALGGSPPKLYPLKVELTQPKYSERRTTTRRLSIRTDESDTSKKHKPTSEAPPPLSQQQLDTKVRATSGSTSISYEIKRFFKIASDNKPHKVPIEDFNFSLEFQYIVHAKSPYAYLKAKAINNTPYQFLEGEMNVFMDEYFITTSKLQQTVPGDIINMYLGVDPGIKVNIKPVFKQDTTSGFLSKKNTQTVNRTTEIINNKNFDVTVLVYQELPFSRDKSIVIKKEEPAHNAKNVEIDNSSVICWTLNIQPNQSQKTKLHYTVEYPIEEQKSVTFIKQTEAPVNY